MHILYVRSLYAEGAAIFPPFADACRMYPELYSPTKYPSSLTPLNLERRAQAASFDFRLPSLVGLGSRYLHL